MASQGLRRDLPSRDEGMASKTALFSCDAHVNSFRFLFAEFLEARIIPERIEHRIEPEQRGSKRHV